MARKFNAGRQGEFLMNPQLFNAYSSVKYLCNGNKMPVQDKQAEIIHGAIWNDTSSNKNVLKVYNSKLNIWVPFFQNYYHPASTTQQPANPVDGQIWIDLNGTLRYYDSGSYQWKIAYAKTTAEVNNARASLTNFQIYPKLSEMINYKKNYTVPDVLIGRLFDFYETKDTVSNTTNEKYNKLVDDGDYIPASQNVSFYYDPPNSQNISHHTWIHLNPTFLNNCTKKLIKVNKENYIIETTTNNSEIYGFKLGDPVGTLLINIDTIYKNKNIKINNIPKDKESDYAIVSGGIKLINSATKYDYVYVITYNFVDKFSIHPGNLIKGKSLIGSTNQVYIGPINDNPILFLDGTYQEQKTYEYEQSTGLITFKGDTITEYMDMLAVSFANTLKDILGEPLDLIITKDNIDKNGNIVYSHEIISNVKNFVHPVALVSGIAGHLDYSNITDQIEINDTTITIKNFGNMEEDDTVSIMIVDTGISYVKSGILEDNFIENENINEDDKFLVFIEGILIGNSEMEIQNNKILLYGDLTNKEYYLIKANEEDEGTYLLFDSPVSYFTTQIDDKNDNVIYNDSNMVLSYVNNDEENFNGILIDENFIKISKDSFTNYIPGQILNIKTENEFGDPFYEYKIFNASGTSKWESFEELYGTENLYKLKDMITQFSGKGSLSIMNNKKLINSNLTYYSYTYVDTIDEPLKMGNRNCSINVKNHILNETQDFYTNRVQTFYANKGCISSYVNGIFIKNTDYLFTQCKFSIDTPLCCDFIKFENQEHTESIDLYPILKSINNQTTIEDLEQLKELKSFYITEDILDKMKILSNAINKMETENELHYIVENTETGEDYAANRIICTAKDRYANFDNTYTSSAFIGPGAINVYLNGVFLERSAYSFFNNCNVILNQIQTAGGSDECNREDPDSWTLIKYYNEETGEIKKLYCEEPDELILEFRNDPSIKKYSYDIKEISYETQSFDTIDYDFPESLLNTKDLIKIYINGILYGGKYTIDNGIIILNDAPLNLNPLKLYLIAHKEIDYNYTPEKDRITFEWR